jgi:AP-3 complex subunit mu
MLTGMLTRVLDHPTGAGGMGPAVGAGAFASPIPWRKAGLRYNNNDIYFDVVEELRSIVNK